MCIYISSSSSQKRRIVESESESEMGKTAETIEENEEEEPSAKLFDLLSRECSEEEITELLTDDLDVCLL